MLDGVLAVGMGFVSPEAAGGVDDPQPAARQATTVSTKRPVRRRSRFLSSLAAASDDTPCGPGGTGVCRCVRTSDPADGRITAVCGSLVSIVNQVYSLLTSRSVDISGTEQLPGTDGVSQGEPSIALGPALRRAWIGYQRRLDSAMADAGYEERRFPDGRVLRLCSDPAGSTISNIGRELGITRQGAGKVVSHLRDRGYVSVADSPTNGREKAVTLTLSGTSYLEAQRAVARTIERQLRKDLGEGPLTALHRLLDVLDAGEEVRMRTYLSSRTTGLSPDDAAKRRDRNR